MEIRVETLADTAALLPRLEAGESVVLLGPDSPGGLRAAPPAEPSLGVYSSGSTGRPTLRFRPWAQLKGEIRLGGCQRWASPFAAHSFAGVQVAIQAWACGGAPLSLPANPVEAWERLLGGGIDGLSCTPSYLQMLMLCEPPGAGGWNPSRIALGGEVLHPRAGVWFGRRFPRATFTVVYAAAETGLLLKTRRLDGWYELESLSRRREWRVVGGRLEIRSGAEWIALPDRIEIQGDLARVVGRLDQVANVGGAKVDLNEVAEAALGVAGVLRASPGREPDPILGEIVVLRCELEPGVSEEEIRPALEGAMRDRLPKPAWPRRWSFGPIQLGPNMKQTIR